MQMRKVFVSQAWPSAAEVEWAELFAQALRGDGYEVFTEWSVENNPPMEAVEQALRESDLIVLLLTSDSTNAPTFFFEYGVALSGGKDLVAVIPEDVEPNQLPIPLLRELYVMKGSPQATATALVTQLRERQLA